MGVPGRKKKTPASKILAVRKKLASTKKIEKAKEWNAPQRIDKALKREEIFKTIRHEPKTYSNMFFSYNTALGPPYRIILDTNFINFSVQNKLDIIKTAMDSLYAKCIIYVTDCVIAELEKLGVKFRVALRVAKDPRFERLTCTHKGIYADDCICHRVENNPVYIVATADRDLRKRLRKIPGVPIMYIKGKRYTVERLPDVDGMAPK